MTGADPRSRCGLAVLGAAHIHLGDLALVLRSQPQVRVVSVWDDDAELAERGAVALDAPPHGDLEAALEAEELRGALVYSKTSRHRAVAAAAGERGLAVFVEKPLAVTQADVTAISETLGNGGLFSTGFFLRYADAFRRLRGAVAGGACGRVHRAAVRVVHGGLRAGWFDGEYAWMREPAEGGGGFFDLAVHCLDLVAWVLGPIEQVIDLSLTASGHHGTAAVRTKSGTVVELEAGWEAPAAVIEMTVTGTAATLTATGDKLLDASTTIVSGRPPDAGAAPDAWLNALVGQPHQPLVTLADAVTCAQAVIGLRHQPTTDLS